MVQQPDIATVIRLPPAPPSVPNTYCILAIQSSPLMIFFGTGRSGEVGVAAVDSDDSSPPRLAQEREGPRGWVSPAADDHAPPMHVQPRQATGNVLVPALGNVAGAPLGLALLQVRILVETVKGTTKPAECIMSVCCGQAPQAAACPHVRDRGLPAALHLVALVGLPALDTRSLHRRFVRLRKVFVTVRTCPDQREAARERDAHGVLRLCDVAAAYSSFLRQIEKSDTLISRSTMTSVPSSLVAIRLHTEGAAPTSTYGVANTKQSGSNTVRFRRPRAPFPALLGMWHGPDRLGAHGTVPQLFGQVLADDRHAVLADLLQRLPMFPAAVPVRASCQRSSVLCGQNSTENSVPDDFVARVLGKERRAGLGHLVVGEAVSVMTTTHPCQGVSVGRRRGTAERKGIWSGCHTQGTAGSRCS